MSLKLRQIKKGMLQGGKTKPAKYTPPRFLYRDANEYTGLPLVPKTLVLIPKKLNKDVSDLDFIGVIKSENPNRKKPKGSKSKQVGPSYRVTIKFEDVKFSETKDKIHTEELEFKGKKLYFKKPSLAKNSAKIRCQCFTGDTLIPLPSGKSVPIKDLVGKDFSVYSFNETTKKMEIAKATNCEAKRKDRIYYVELDNSHIVKCTGDHKFLTRAGDWVEAQDLKSGTPLETLQGSISHIHSVVEVRRTEEFEMTYCLTVKKNNNFAIKVNKGDGILSGIIVHNCADFCHRFGFPIAKAGALAYGIPVPYIRKTPEWTLGNIKKWEDDKTGTVKKPYPYANPTDKLGYCKHIHSLLAYLIDDAKLVKQT